MKKIKVGVVGVGHLGQHHARIYANSPMCELVGIADKNRKVAAKIANAYKTQVFFDYKNLLGKVEAVSIAVPTVYHYEIAKDFIEQKTHVLVEKPITTTIEEAADLINLSNTHNVILQVGHIERFNAAIRKLKSIIDKPKFIEAHRLGPYDPRVKDIGVVLDLMIHDIDIVLQVVDSPVKSIDAVGVGIYSEKEDIANARIKFENGCTANLTVSRVTPVKKRKIRFFQNDAYISVNYAKQTMEIYNRIALPKVGAGENPITIKRKKVRLEKEEPLKVELEHFLECVQKGKEPEVTGVDARNALNLAVTISELIRNKRNV